MEFAAPNASDVAAGPAERLLKAESVIRTIPNFPQPGIMFRDITPVLADPQAMREVIDRFIQFAVALKPDLIVGIESRGFVFGMPLALELGIGFVPARKAGKLPFTTIHEEYTLEYGTNRVEMHSDAIQPGQRVLIVDDLLATGGTAHAAEGLVHQLGGVICGFAFLVELAFLKGRNQLESKNVLSLISYDEE